MYTYIHIDIFPLQTMTEKLFFALISVICKYVINLNHLILFQFYIIGMNENYSLRTNCIDMKIAHVKRFFQK